MAMLTVRNLEESLKSQLRMRAAEHGCSMEEEVRRILREVLLPAAARKGLGTHLHRRIEEMGAGGELEIPARSEPRSNPFSERSDS